VHKRLVTTFMAVAVICGAAARADAQPRDEWQVSVVPYLWLTRVDGDLSAGPVTVPIFLKFADAADIVDSAFSFHFEASRGRWGVLTDLNFIRLSSSSTFTVAGRPIEGEFRIDNVMFELGGSFLVNEHAGLGLIGGLRTYTLSPKLEFRGTNTGATPIDTSATAPNAFVGFVIRKRFKEKWTFLGRADIGGGAADLTWSALVGFEYRITSWGGLEFGYKGLGIDVKYDDRIVLGYDMTHYGPIAGFRFHWGR
jgi:hypothetical protein